MKPSRSARNVLNGHESRVDAASPAARSASPRHETSGAEEPAGLQFVPIDAGMAGQPLRICVAVRGSSNGDSERRLILLRSTADARIYLGAQLDAADTVREWLEIWIQTVSGLAQSPARIREHLSNQLLDDRWRAVAASCRASDGAAFIDTGWEAKPPRPSFVNRKTGQIEHPCSADGKPLRLCVDDSLLRSAELSGYASSLHRYWTHERVTEEAPEFYAATVGAPRAPRVRARDEASGASGEPLNPEGGLLMVRRYAALSLDDYLDLVGDKPWAGITGGVVEFRSDAHHQTIGALDSVLNSSGRLFLEGRGRPGRFIETFHLRLRLFYEIVRLVRDAVARQRLPLLNLSADSFRVDLPATSPGLPLLWSTCPVLVKPGQAIALPIAGSDVRHFLPLESAAMSIFRAESMGASRRGQAEVRLRKVEIGAMGDVCLDGTFFPSAALQPMASDLVWLKLPLATGMVDLFGHVDAEEGLAAGESRFRSVAQDMNVELGRALQAAEGSGFAGVEFETIPMLSTPCDLYALGVIGVRILFVDSRNTLSVALDEILSFARELGKGFAADADVGTRALQLVASDPRWTTSLGSHRLSPEQLDPAEASRWLPDNLWWRTVATLARFFPGQGGDSYCRDFGDGATFAPERVFERPLADLDSLTIRSRGLLFSDWTAHQEVAAVIRRLR